MPTESQTKQDDAVFYNGCVVCSGRWHRGMNDNRNRGPAGHWFKVTVLKCLKLVRISDSCSMTYVKGIRSLSLSSSKTGVALCN